MGQGDEKGAEGVHSVLHSVLKTPGLGQSIKCLSFRSYGIKAGMFFHTEGYQLLDEWVKVVKLLYISTTSQSLFLS